MVQGQFMIAVAQGLQKENVIVTGTYLMRSMFVAGDVRMIWTQTASAMTQTHVSAKRMSVVYAMDPVQFFHAAVRGFLKAIVIVMGIKLMP